MRYQFFFEVSGPKTMEVFNTINEAFPGKFTHKRIFDTYGNRLESPKVEKGEEMELLTLKKGIKKLMEEKFPTMNEYHPGDWVLEKHYDYRFWNILC